MERTGEGPQGEKARRAVRTLFQRSREPRRPDHGALGCSVTVRCLLSVHNLGLDVILDHELRLSLGGKKSASFSAHTY